MFERFTEQAIKSIMLAQEEARRLGHNFVGTEQMLLGIIGEGHSKAATCLKSMGVTLKDARAETEKIIGRGSGFVAIEIPFTPRAKRALELSWDNARKLGDNFIGTEHLLLGLLSQGDGVAIRVLENLKVDLSSLRSCVIRGSREPIGSEPEIGEFGEILSNTNFAFRRDAVEVIKQAINGASFLGAGNVTTEHILCALLEDERTASMVRQSTESYSELRLQLVGKIEPDPEMSSKSRELTEEARQVLHDAWIEASDLRQSTITRESIFLGLLRQPESSPIKVSLAKSGFDEEKVRSWLRGNVDNVVSAEASVLDEIVAVDTTKPEAPPLKRIAFFVLLFAAMLAIACIFFR